MPRWSGAPRRRFRRSTRKCLTVDVKDRFGSYGLTGVVIFRAAADALAVDTFLLSCRALGRGVEHRMVARLGEIALERGLARVEIPFVAGQRNRPGGDVSGIDRTRADGSYRPRPRPRCGTQCGRRSRAAARPTTPAQLTSHPSPRVDYLQDRHRAAHARRDSGADPRRHPQARAARAVAIRRARRSSATWRSSGRGC